MAPYGAFLIILIKNMKEATKLDKDTVRKKLIELYSQFLEDSDNEELKESAKKIYWDYQAGADHFLDEASSVAVWQSIYIYTEEMTREKAEEILDKLKKTGKF